MDLKFVFRMTKGRLNQYLKEIRDQKLANQMTLKCTYISVAKQNCRVSVPPDPVGEVRNLGNGPETRMERWCSSYLSKEHGNIIRKILTEKMSFK